MNQGRIWCVVNPTVGLPLFLGSVTLISFTVHAAVMENTTWVKSFFQGGQASATAEVAKPIATAANGYTIHVSPTGADGSVKVDVTPALGGEQAMNNSSWSPTKAPPPTGG
jgi:light-harvesting protein B-800-850 alpha chain